MLNNRLNFKQTLLPQQCLLCGSTANETGLCSPCWDDLPFSPDHVCPVCAADSPTQEVCGACLKDTPAFDHTVAAMRYQFPVGAMMQRFKYGGHLTTGKLLGLILASKLNQHSLPDIMTAMPLHLERLRERGYNQALEIAKEIASYHPVKLSPQLCQRTRATPQQAGLSQEDRKKNLRGAFQCDADLTGLHIAIVDDVLTSGASLHELAKTLKKAGATRVTCWVVARTIKYS